VRGTFILASSLLIGQLSYSQGQTSTQAPKTTGPTTASHPAASKSAAPKSPSAAAPKAAVTPTLVTDEQKTIYALGLSIYHSLAQFNLSPSELEIIKHALTDAAANKPAEDISVWGPKIQGLAQSRAAIVAQREKAASDVFLAKAAAEPGAVKAPTGFIYRELMPGSGPSPAASDTVTVNYKGTLVDGSVFDSSYARNQPAQFALSGVIPCWTQGLQMMKVGGKGQLVCPANLAYGEQGRPGIPPGATLIFEIELLKIGGGQ